MPRGIKNEVQIPLEGKLSLLGLFLTISTGKWGSWIGIPDSPFFLIDFVIFSAAVIAFLKMLYIREIIDFYTLSLFFFIVVQLSRKSESELFVRFQDISPFVYLLLVPFLTHCLRSIALRNFILVLRFGSLSNLTIFYLTYFEILKPFDCGSICGSDLFYYRADHVALVSCIGIMAWSSFPNCKLKSQTPVILLFVIGIMLNQSRVGILGLVIVILLFTLPRVRKVTNLKRLNLKGAVISIMIVMFGTLILSWDLSTNSGIQRVSEESVFAQISGAADGTTRARIIAQGILIRYVFNENGDYMFGAAPGSEMVRDSQAFRYLSGASDVRAPHNWFVGLLARYGIFGFVFWLIGVIYYFKLGSDQKKNFTLGSVATIIILTFSFFGVMMESPFGAIPFAYFLSSKIAYSGKQTRSH
jgi:hypothetical protein